MPLRLVGVCLGNQARDHIDHLGNMLSSVWHNSGRQIIQRLHIVKIGFRITGRQNTNILTQLRSGLHNLVFNIGDIARVLNIGIETHQQPIERIKHHSRAGIAYMHTVVDRWPTDIHSHPLAIYGLERLLAAGHAVV